MSKLFLSKLLLIVFTCNLGCLIANAQTPERCATVDNQKRLLQNDPLLAAKLAAAQQQIQQYAAAHPNDHQRSVITIPVVVHVINNGEAIGTGSNISDEQIRSEIDVLNHDYRKLNADTSNTPSVFKPLAADIEVEFCLAVRGPNGQPTNGIDRYNGHQASWIQQDIDNNLKPATIWNRNLYLNIWTVKLGGSSSSILGYAIMPGNDSTIDGVVIGYQYFGNTGNVTAPYNKGRTSTHEIGHWLGLYHTWSDNGAANDPSCTDSDGIADTPNQGSANYGCPNFPHVSCTNGPNGDMFMNYMDYVDDGCMNMFTQGQKAVEQATLNTVRSSIKTSNGCLRYTYDVALLEVRLPKGQVCNSTFRPLVKISNEGLATMTTCVINYIVDGNGINQYSWTGNLPTGQSEYVTLDVITTTVGAHSIEIFVNGPNNHPDQNNANDDETFNFTVLSNTAGNTLPMMEGFESGASLPNGWVRDSVGADTIRWNVSQDAGYNSASSVWVNNFAGTANRNSRGKKDYLLTPALYLPYGKYPHITFDVAYARRDSTSKDSLVVAYSIDCGANWYTLYAKGGAFLETAAPTTTSYLPGATDWRHEDLVMPEVTGQDHVLLRFENHSDWGNNIFVDNININEFRVGIAEVGVPAFSAVISPNPSTGKFTIKFDRSLPEHSVIETFDIIGRQVYKATGISGTAAEMDLSGKDAGIYLVKISSGNSSIVKKVVLQ